MDENALSAAESLAPDGAQMLRQLVGAAESLGKQAQFASLAQHLRSINADFDDLIMEIAAQNEIDVDLHQEELVGAIRSIKVQQIKAEQTQLANSGLQNEADKLRYYELKRQLDELNRQTLDEIALR